MAHNVLSATLGGIDAQAIEVQIDSAPGLHSFTIVGLPDKAVQESIDRIGAAIKQGGLVPPGSKNKRFVVNLAPADVKKEGSGYDLAIAIAYLTETRQLAGPTEGLLLLGELSLDGRLGHTSGVLAAALLVKESGLKGLIVPLQNAAEAAIVEGIEVFGAATLAQVISHLDGTHPLPRSVVDSEASAPPYGDDSFSHIRGQTTAKRALIVAAAGAHNILMSGTPGSGKTLLARAIAGLLPPMSVQEAIEVAKIQSSCGLLRGPVTSIPRPFCAPHHTSSPAAIVGGGSTIRPGQISLAHRGVLFLDELPEFARNVLEALRQPLEDGTVTVSRASATLTMPAKFMLVAAMNPCPCGNLGDENAICVCAPASVARYQKRVSGPLLDRMDIQVHVARESVTSGLPQEDIADTRKRILDARNVQAQRLKPAGLVTNSELTHRNIDRIAALDVPAERLISEVVNRRHLSLRAYHKVKKIGRTIADLEGSPGVQEHHIAEALALRISDSSGN